MDRKYLFGILGVVLVVVIIVFVRNINTQRIPESAAAPKVDTKQLYQKVQELKKDRNVIEAKQLYQKILTEHPDIDNVEHIQKELEELNMEIIFSNINSPKSILHEVKSGDTLGELAKKYGTTIELIKRNNNLKSDVIRIGQKLRIWKGRFNIFVDKSQNILILKAEDEVIKVYAVSTGENNSTPTGTFKVTSKLVDPVWFNRGVVVPPESPQNVLGSRWLGFDLPGYGIHGTIEPDTIGRQITAGCVRMRNEDVEEIYSIVPRGTEVVIVD